MSMWRHSSELRLSHLILHKGKGRQRGQMPLRGAPFLFCFLRSVGQCRHRRNWNQRWRRTLESQRLNVYRQLCTIWIAACEGDLSNLGLVGAVWCPSSKRASKTHHFGIDSFWWWGHVLCESEEDLRRWSNRVWNVSCSIWREVLRCRTSYSGTLEY